MDIQVFLKRNIKGEVNKILVTYLQVLLPYKISVSENLLAKQDI